MTGLAAVSSVRGNVTANLAGKIIGVVVNLACIPVYIRILGIGGYGLIGIWATIETLANLLDLGLSPTMTREMALLAAPGASPQQGRDLVRTLEVIYWSLALLIGGAVIATAPLIATHWIRSAQISPAETRAAIAMIGVLIACRWPLTFYSGGLAGLERQVALVWATTGGICLANLGAVAVLLWVSPTVLGFFAWQVAANLGQTLLLTVLLWKFMPAGAMPRVRWRLLRGIGRFAGGTTGIALVSMLLTDLDKIIVSKRFSLEIFGYYTLAWRIATVLSLLSISVYRGLFPALCRLARSDRAQLTILYHRACQLISVLVIPAATVIVLFGREIIFAWTGNAALAAKVYPAAALLTVGSALNALAILPFALQLAYGWTALALYVNLISLIVSIPLLLAATTYYGIAGAAAVWMLINLSYLFSYIPLAHQSLLSGAHWNWYVVDTGVPLIVCAAAGGVLFALSPAFDQRVLSVIPAVIAFGLITLASALATPVIRDRIAAQFAFAGALWRRRLGQRA